jgi:hypothetical protein
LPGDLGVEVERMGTGREDGRTSTLLVDESFASAGDQFLELVRSVSAPKYLAALADRWKRDPRPWARDQVFAYLTLPLDRPGHETVVKRLFKHAEAESDDELMAAFAAALDRLVRRERRLRYRWDFEVRQYHQVEVLQTPSNQIPRQEPPQARTGVNPFTGEMITFQPPPRKLPKNGRLFSYKTRYYLRRRAWRYFRRMGFMRPADYPRAIARALVRYHDEDLALGENILDSWSLMNACFRYSQVLEFSNSRVHLEEGHSLSELTAAPRFEELWSQRDAAPLLLELVIEAESRLVRVWAMQLVKRHHVGALREITPGELLRLLDHSDEEMQQFGAELLVSAAGVDSWTVDVWLRLLETHNLSALATICDVMAQRVRPERLNLAQCIDLACARATPVARLGLAWLGERTITTDDERAQIGRLAGARCDALGEEIAGFALGIVADQDVYHTDAVIRFFDSLNPRVRNGAFAWLTPESAGYSDADLWSRLVETPFDDVRIRVINELQVRISREEAHPPVPASQLTAVWTAVLLGIHRGNRAKRKALRQIAEALAVHPDRADELLPVLAVAIRSVRPAEARAGLSAILTAVALRPELEAKLAEAIPELRLTPQGVPA